MSCDTDLIYIGDGGLSEEVQEQFAMYQREQTILLHAEVIDAQFYEYILGNHINRQDEARDVIRSADARFRNILKFLLVIRKNEQKERLL